MLGLCSMLDRILGVSMTEAIAPMHLAEPLEAVLRGEGDAVRRSLLDLAIAAEQGAWATVQRLCQQMSMPRNRLTQVYFSTLSEVQRWSYLTQSDR